MSPAIRPAIRPALRPVVREGREGDVDAVAAIYDREVLLGHATFATVPSDPGTWRDRITGPDPFLVGEADGRVVAMAWSGEYRPRAAYHLTRETSLYLAPEAQGQGLGTRLYADLLNRLRAADFHTALAMVALPNDASLRLHRAAGFETVGTLREVGDKHDRLIDVTVLQLML